MTGFDGFGGSGEHLVLLCLSYTIQYLEEAILMVLAVSAVVAVPVVTATDLKLNLPFPTS